jgi:hypothetical protein
LIFVVQDDFNDLYTLALHGFYENILLASQRVFLEGIADMLCVFETSLESFYIAIFDAL